VLLGARLRLPAAGAGQELRVQGREVDGVIPTAPAEDRVSAHINSGHRDGRAAAGHGLQRNQSDHETVDTGGGGEALYVTETLPLTSVAMVDTYFEAPPNAAFVTSQPQLLAPGALVAL